MKRDFCFDLTKILQDRGKKIKGFTLIELLVVIFIIGLLSSLSVVAVLSYRNKAKDTRIEAVLSQVRKEATLIYNESSSYNNPGNDLCAGDNTLNDGNSNHPDLNRIEVDVKNFNGNRDVTCYASDDRFCVQSPLVITGDYCLDSTGYAGTIANCDNINIDCQ